MATETPEPLAGAIEVETMRAIVQDRYGAPETYRLGAIPIPSPSDDEVLVEVRAAAVNPADWHFMTGTPWIVRVSGGGLRRPKNEVPGLDASGVVVAVGSAVTKFTVGDAVFGEVGGGYAEYLTASERRLSLKPANLTHEQAAAVPIAAITALQGLRDKGELAAGHRVLVIGASGGVGTFAVQIAKALGAEVTAVCSTRNLEMVKSIGADQVIDYTVDDFVESATRYDVILDAIGNRPLADYRQVMTPTGRYVGVGGPKRMRYLLPRMAHMAIRSRFAKQKMISMLANQTPDDMQVLSNWLEAGAIVPVIDRTYPLAEAAMALAHLGEGHARGKIVITISPEPATEES